MKGRSQLVVTCMTSLCLLSLIYSLDRTRIITRRLPEDKRNHYSIRQINKQAAIYQSFMYHYKLNYEAFLDKSTLEERVIRCANMAMGRDLRGLKRPRLIVKINVEKDYC